MKRIVLIVSAVLLLLIIVCALYASRMIHRGFSTRTEPMQTEKALATAIRGRAIPSRYKTMKNPVASTSEVIHEGMAHWADHCTACHANNGSGDTMYGRAMYPRPPDMRQKDTQELSDGELYYTIKNGVRLSGMPAFGDPGDDDVDSWKLVAFIRHLPQLTDAEETEMQRLNPKSPDEIQEEKEEEDFLNGDTRSATPATKMHRH
ncbi:MAG TPA: c-type cytochrome [Edaphobacter sp.]|nr:c-type cytochrome [Edaphobacter sp.]